MDIILVPGFWLDASSWSEVTPPLVAAGHRVHPLTLPGLESVDASRVGIGLRQHIEAVVAAVDAIAGPVVLVGHSGGGAIIYGAADARPDRVVRTVYVDSVPPGEGDVINDGLPAVGDEVPLPAWEDFDEADLTDLDEELRAAFRARAVPEPVAVARDRQHLRDERRFGVPATVIACEFPARQLPSGSRPASRTWRSSDGSATSNTSTYRRATGHSSPSPPSSARRFWPPSTLSDPRRGRT